MTFPAPVFNVDVAPKQRRKSRRKQRRCGTSAVIWCSCCLKFITSCLVAGDTAAGLSSRADYIYQRCAGKSLCLQPLLSCRTIIFHNAASSETSGVDNKTEKPEAKSKWKSKSTSVYTDGKARSSYWCFFLSLLWEGRFVGNTVLIISAVFIPLSHLGRSVHPVAWKPMPTFAFGIPCNSLLLSSLPLFGTWGSSLTRSYLLLSISPPWLALASTTYASFGWFPALFPLLLLPP